MHAVWFPNCQLIRQQSGRRAPQSHAVRCPDLPANQTAVRTTGSSVARCLVSQLPANPTAVRTTGSSVALCLVSQLGTSRHNLGETTAKGGRRNVSGMASMARSSRTATSNFLHRGDVEQLPTAAARSGLQSPLVEIRGFSKVMQFASTVTSHLLQHGDFWSCCCVQDLPLDMTLWLKCWPSVALAHMIQGPAQGTYHCLPIAPMAMPLGGGGGWYDHTRMIQGPAQRAYHGLLIAPMAMPLVAAGVGTIFIIWFRG